MNTEHEEIVQMLVCSRAFQGLSGAQLLDFAKLPHVITIEAGDFVVREGDIADNFYIITDGKVLVLKEDIGKNQFLELATLYPGDTLGELSLIENSPHSARSASIKAMTKTEVLAFRNAELYDEERMPRSSFNALVFNLAQLICHRLRQSNERKIACLYESNL